MKYIFFLSLLFGVTANAEPFDVKCEKQVWKCVNGCSWYTESEKTFNLNIHKNGSGHQIEWWDASVQDLDLDGFTFNMHVRQTRRPDKRTNEVSVNFEIDDTIKMAAEGGDRVVATYLKQYPRRGVRLICEKVGQ